MTNDLSRQRQRVNSWMADNGAAFSMQYHGQLQTPPAPYDPVPLVLEPAEFTALEQGLIQRVCALNLFLGDIYGNRRIIHDGIIPEEFIYSSPAFQPSCMNLKPVKALYNHLTATDLIRSDDGQWYVLQDHLAVPRGACWTHLSRKLSRAVSPEAFEIPGLCDNCGLDILLKQLYSDLAAGLPSGEGLTVFLKPAGRDVFEADYLAELTGSVVAEPSELTVMEDAVYYRSREGGGFQKVAVIHRLFSDNDLDPLVFDVTSLLGVPHLLEAYRRGQVAIVNAPGCGIADDQGLNCFVPQMIRYYLDEEPLLPNVPTWLPWYPEQKDYILEHLQDLLILDISGDLTRTTGIYAGPVPVQEYEAVKELLQDPRQYVARQRMNIAPWQAELEAGTYAVQGKLRCYTVYSDSIRVWMGGLGRFSGMAPDGSIVTGFRDVRVMSEQEAQR